MFGGGKAGEPCKRCKPMFEELREALRLSEEKLSTSEKNIVKLKGEVEQQKKDSQALDTRLRKERKDSEDALKQNHDLTIKKLEDERDKERSSLQSKLAQAKSSADELQQQKDVGGGEQHQAELNEMQQRFEKQIRRLEKTLDAERKQAEEDVRGLESDFEKMEEKLRSKLLEKKKQVGDLKDEVGALKESLQEKDRDLEKQRMEIAGLQLAESHLRGRIEKQNEDHIEEKKQLQKEWAESEYGHRKAQGLDAPMAYRREPPTDNDLLELKLRQLKQGLGAVGVSGTGRGASSSSSSSSSAASLFASLVSPPTTVKPRVVAVPSPMHQELNLNLTANGKMIGASAEHHLSTRGRSGGRVGIVVHQPKLGKSASAASAVAIPPDQQRAAALQSQSMKNLQNVETHLQQRQAVMDALLQ
ncbi:unnamed protein product [Amoebophrya sp. A25]|nr:unnamed protein product [Amoebophrya sp. A25]|eukprot:GSA25T00004757001.1